MSTLIFTTPRVVLSLPILAALSALRSVEFALRNILWMVAGDLLDEE